MDLADSMSAARGLLCSETVLLYGCGLVFPPAVAAVFFKFDCLHFVHIAPPVVTLTNYLIISIAPAPVDR